MGHENILKQNDAVSAQFYRFPEDHWIEDLKWMDFAVCNYTSKQQLTNTEIPFYPFKGQLFHQNTHTTTS